MRHLKLNKKTLKTTLFIAIMFYFLFLLSGGLSIVHVLAAGHLDTVTTPQCIPYTFLYIISIIICFIGVTITCTSIEKNNTASIRTLTGLTIAFASNIIALYAAQLSGLTVA